MKARSILCFLGLLSCSTVQLSSNTPNGSPGARGNQGDRKNEDVETNENADEDLLFLDATAGFAFNASPDLKGHGLNTRLSLGPVLNNRFRLGPTVGLFYLAYDRDKAGPGESGGDAPGDTSPRSLRTVSHFGATFQYAFAGSWNSCAAYFSIEPGVASVATSGQDTITFGTSGGLGLKFPPDSAGILLAVQPFFAVVNGDLLVLVPFVAGVTF